VVVSTIQATDEVGAEKRTVWRCLCAQTLFERDLEPTMTAYNAIDYDAIIGDITLALRSANLAVQVTCDGWSLTHYPSFVVSLDPNKGAYSRVSPESVTTIYFSTQS
jgi:hypothetical protein